MAVVDLKMEYEKLSQRFHRLNSTTFQWKFFAYDSENNFSENLICEICG